MVDRVCIADGLWMGCGWLHRARTADGLWMAAWWVVMVQYLSKNGAGHYTFNLGTGKGYSVLEMVAAMSKACGHEIAYKVHQHQHQDHSISTIIMRHAVRRRVASIATHRHTRRVVGVLPRGVGSA